MPKFRNQRRTNNYTRAKKDGVIKSFEIDMNGRIFVRYLDNKTSEIIDIDDIHSNQNS